MAKSPEQIAGDSEHSQQAALLCWANQYGWSTDERLKYLYAVPNGGGRSKSEAGKFAAEGVKKGVPDLVLPVVIWETGNQIIKPGLYIEMKKPGLQNRKNGALSEDQIRWRDFLLEQGYEHLVCYLWNEAKDGILRYLNNR